MSEFEIEQLKGLSSIYPILAVPRNIINLTKCALNYLKKINNKQDWVAFMSQPY